MEPIPFFKPSVGLEEAVGLLDTLRTGWLTTGAKTRQFEEEFAAYARRKHAIAVNSCTAALHLGLEAIGISDGDGVLVPTMTFAATAEVVHYCRARPILVDCRESDLNLDMDDAGRRLLQAQREGLKVKAIMPVHFAGLPGDMASIGRLARENQLRVVEDAAHCCPAYYRKDENSPWLGVGDEADVSCFSFYANKPITTGEGGMACTDDDALCDRMRVMSLHGISRDAWKRFKADGNWYYEILAPGFKYNMTDIAASIGLQQLRKANSLHMARARIAGQYAALLSDVEELVLPQVPSNRVHSWHLYFVRLKLERLTISRADVISLLKQAGIGTSVHYLPLHMHPYYREAFNYEPRDLPCAAGIYPQIITLPNYPGMATGEVEYVCSTLKTVIASHLKPQCYRKPLGEALGLHRKGVGGPNTNDNVGLVEERL